MLFPSTQAKGRATGSEVNEPAAAYRQTSIKGGRGLRAFLWFAAGWYIGEFLYGLFR